MPREEEDALDDDIDEPQYHPGYDGAFSTGQAAGAIPNESRVWKTASRPGDTYPDGTPGTVMGSVGRPGVGIGYFVSFDPNPRQVVFMNGERLTDKDPQPSHALSMHAFH
jgi:hypothetical protein